MTYLPELEGILSILPSDLIAPFDPPGSSSIHFGLELHHQVWVSSLPVHIAGLDLPISIITTRCLIIDLFLCMCKILSLARTLTNTDIKLILRITQLGHGTLSFVHIVGFSFQNFYWAFLCLCSQGILAYSFLSLGYHCLALVSGWYWPHGINWEHSFSSVFL